jgi:hypothetical protein
MSERAACATTASDQHHCGDTEGEAGEQGDEHGRIAAGTFADGVWPAGSGAVASDVGGASGRLKVVSSGATATTTGVGTGVGVMKIVLSDSGEDVPCGVGVFGVGAGSGGVTT